MRAGLISDLSLIPLNPNNVKNKDLISEVIAHITSQEAIIRAQDERIAELESDSPVLSKVTPIL